MAIEVTKNLRVKVADFGEFERLEAVTGLRRVELFHRLIETWIEVNEKPQKNVRVKKNG